MSADPETLSERLDALGDDGGTVEVERDGGSAEVEVVDVDRLGVKVRGVKVRRDADRDVAREAAALPGRLRALPDPIEPMEVSPELGGAILRTPSERIQRGRFFEVDVRPRQTHIGRHEVGADGERRPVDWTMTRDQLERLIDEASDDGAA